MTAQRYNGSVEQYFPWARPPRCCGLHYMIELLKRFAAPYRRHMVLGPVFKLLEVVFDLCTPVIVALMIDRGVGGRDVHAVVMYGVMLAIMALVGFGFTLVCQKMASLASQGMGTDMRDALFTHINELSHADIDRFGTPTLITRITGDINQVQLAVALGIRQLIRFPLLAVGSMIAALAIDLELGLVFLVATPLVCLVFWVVMARCVPLFKLVQNKLDRVGLITREGLSGARVVRAFVREGHEHERFAAAADEQAAVSIVVGRLSSVLNPATMLIMNLAVCAILWMGGLRVDVGGLTQGQVMAFVNYMTQTLLAIVYVANLVVVFTKASASASRVIEVLDCEPSIVDAGGAEPAVACMPRDASAPAIRMRQATFSFAGASAPALQDISLELPVGGTLGVIGGTGSGKSTLVSLIPRLYDVSSGEVEVFGRDVRSWSLEALRQAVGLVPQRAQLVSGSIRSNLLWRDENATDDELWEALEVAQAAGFVRALSAGLDAPVEAGGKNFSGGQRQRLTIARALVGSPDVLILDDSSSALDAKTDAELRAAIRALSASRARGFASDSASRAVFSNFDPSGAVETQENSPQTEKMPAKATPAVAQQQLTTVIVSQRVSSVRDADLICVLYHGAIAGLGTHDELLASCDIYREIVDSQLKREVD